MKAFKPKSNSYLLLSACLFVALATTVQSYDTNKIYSYKLGGTILSELANEKVPQFSGVSIKSDLLLEKLSDGELAIKLDKPTFAPINAQTDNLELSKLSYRPFDATASLEKPFRIYIEEKNVKAFDSFKDEPKWVSNFKRGLLSFFQLKLNSAGDNDRSSAYFTTSEKSVFGECDTDYVIIGGGEHSSEQPVANEIFNVTKTRNVAKCKTRFMHKMMPVDAEECVADEKDLQEFKHASSIFTYNLVGSKSNYYIESANLDERTVYSPFGRKALSPSVSTKFNLLLDNVKSASNHLNVDSSNAIRVDNLAYDPPELHNFYANVNLDEEHHLANIYSMRTSVDNIMIAFDELVAELKKYSSTLEGSGNERVGYQQNTRTAELFMRLADLTGTLSTQKLEQLYSKIDELSSDIHKKVFWDLMSVTGTNPAFMFMKKLILDGDAPSSKVKDYLTYLSFHIKAPSKALFDEYINLCKSEKIQNNQNYKRLCSLPLASLINQHCAKPHTKYLRMQQEGLNATSFKKAQNLCQISTAEEYFTRLVTVPVPSASSSSSSGSDTNEQTNGDKLFNILLAGELGARPSIDMLVDIVRRSDEHPTLRAAAMWNLMKPAKIYPTQVKKFVVPYFYDSSETLEVRIAALYSWMFAGISLPELETIASKLNDEPSRQLVLYVSSLFSSIETLKQFSCENQLSKHIELIKPLLERAVSKHAPGSLSDSKARISANWQKDFSYGTASLTSLILSNESFMPSNLHFSTFDFMSGHKLRPMTINVQAHGLDKLVKRVIGINGLFADKATFMDVFSLKRRARRQASGEQLVKQEVADIEKELKLATREFSDVFLAVTVSVFGRPVMYFDKDSRELKKMLSDDGTIKIPQIKKLLHSFNNHTSQQMLINFEKLEMFNNELGLPIINHISDFELKTVKLNSVKLDVEPGFFRDERQGKPPTRITANLDARYSRQNDLFAGLSTIFGDSRQRFGAGFYKKKLVNLPAKFNLDINLQDKKITIEREPIHENLLYIKQYPLTFVKRYDEYKTGEFKSDVNEWLPLYDFNNSEVMKPFDLEYMTPLALGVKAIGKHKAGADWSMPAWIRYFTANDRQNAMFMYKYSPLGSPLEVAVSTITTQADANPTKKMTYSFSWIHAYPTRAQAEGPINDIEREVEAETGKKQVARPTSVAYNALITGGSEKERKVSIDIQYSKAFGLHKWKVFYQRTPFDQSSTSKSEVTNLCWLASAKFPQYNIDKLLKFDVLSTDNSVHMTSNLIFGDECSTDRVETAPAKVVGQGYFNWSDQQRGLVEKLLSNKATCSLGKLYKKCLENRNDTKSSIDQSCIQVLERITELLHVNAHFDYKDVPERWIKIGSRLGMLYSYARANYIDEIDDELYSKHSAEYKSADGSFDRARLNANFSISPHNREVSYSFENPNFRVKYSNVPIGIPMISTFPLFDKNYYKTLQHRQENRICTVEADHVTTFDGVSYKLPQIGDGCLKLVAKDCSPENNFIVLGAKVGNGKLIKVYVGQKYKVEFVPDKDGKSVADVKINGESVPGSELAGSAANKPPVTRSTKIGAREVEAFSIDHNGSFYILTSKLYKFSISTDGTWLLVNQSKYYAGKSCGICGDANGDQQNEYKSPTSARKVCRTANDFAWSYVLPSTCASRPTIECN